MARANSFLNGLNGGVLAMPFYAVVFPRLARAILVIVPAWLGLGRSLQGRPLALLPLVAGAVTIAWLTIWPAGAPDYLASSGTARLRRSDPEATGSSGPGRSLLLPGRPPSWPWRPWRASSRSRLCSGGTGDRTPCSSSAWRSVSALPMQRLLLFRRRDTQRVWSRDCMRGASWTIRSGEASAGRRRLQRDGVSEQSRHRVAETQSILSPSVTRCLCGLKSRMKLRYRLRRGAGALRPGDASRCSPRVAIRPRTSSNNIRE